MVMIAWVSTLARRMGRSAGMMVAEAMRNCSEAVTLPATEKLDGRRAVRLWGQKGVSTIPLLGRLRVHWTRLVQMVYQVKADSQHAVLRWRRLSRMNRRAHRGRSLHWSRVN